MYLLIFAPPAVVFAFLAMLAPNRLVATWAGMIAVITFAVILAFEDKPSTEIATFMHLQMGWPTAAAVLSILAILTVGPAQMLRWRRGLGGASYHGVLCLCGLCFIGVVALIFSLVGV